MQHELFLKYGWIEGKLVSLILCRFLILILPFFLLWFTYFLKGWTGYVEKNLRCKLQSIHRIAFFLENFIRTHTFIIWINKNATLHVVLNPLSDPIYWLRPLPSHIEESYNFPMTLLKHKGVQMVKHMGDSGGFGW